jgi:chitinase
VDQAGNTRASTTVAARIVDNNGPVVSVTGPAQVRGTTNTVTTTVTDASAITSVVIRRRATGSTGAQTTLCTDNTGPAYTCTWNASALADGSSWELTAVATDALGRSTTSAIYTSVVNSTGPTGTDVQSTNGGTDDRLDSGDRVIFSFSAQIAPASILPGWNGTSTAIRVRVNDSGTSDSMELYDSTNTTPLNLLASGTALMINGDHVSAASLFNATIARSGTTVTVTIGSLISGGVRSGVTGSSPMVWQTNPAMTNTTGKGLFPTTVTESGSADVDF